MRAVTFAKSVGPYVAGDVAAFPDAEAAAHIERGEATPYPAETAEAAAEAQPPASPAEPQPPASPGGDGDGGGADTQSGASA